MRPFPRQATAGPGRRVAKEGEPREHLLVVCWSLENETTARSAKRANPEDNFAVRSDGRYHIDYKTHILLASTSSDRMTAICHWPYVPRQIEVAQKIDAVQETYAGRLTYG